jgi:hypothetical protein
MGTGAFLSWFLFLLFLFLAFLLFSRVFVESVGAFPDHHIVFPDPLNHRFAGMHMLPHVPCWGVEVSHMGSEALFSLHRQLRRREAERAEANRLRVQQTRGTAMPHCPPQEWWYTRAPIDRSNAVAARPNRGG